ncbi:putative NAD(P)/FAD-binding protein YdhS [Bradyrhizobium sp. USDA 377]
MAGAAAELEAPIPGARPPWWDVHRHRTAPEVEARIAEALAAKRLTIIAGKLAAITPNPGGALVRYRRRSQSETSELQVGAIVDCTGIVRDPGASTNPAVRSLLDQGLARIDPLRIGIDVTRDCAIIDRDGSPSRRLYAVGPLTRAAFWEIIAVPDIRQQCAELAARLRAIEIPFVWA